MLGRITRALHAIDRAALRARLGRGARTLRRAVSAVDRSLLARPLLNAPAAGGLYLGLLYLSFVTTPLVPPDEVLFGRDAKELADRISVLYAAEIREIGLTLGAVAVGIGIALGVAALLLLVLRDAFREGPAARRTGFAAAGAGLVVAMVLHGFALLLSMSKWPQLYAAHFWVKGGALAQLQVLATDHLRTKGLLVIMGSALFFFVAGPPWTWRQVGRRAFAAAGRAYRRPGALLVSLGLVAAVTVAVTTVLGRAKDPAASAQAHVPRTEAAATRSRPRRSVLVIASDGLRPDRIRPEIAPRLYDLTARGTSFESAYVDIPRTMSSWTTMLTGLHPHHHGIRSGFPQWSEVSPPPDTLPARLKASGYKTAAVSDYVGEIFGRVDFGFGLVDVPPSNFPAFLREHAVERSTPLLPFLQTRTGRELVPEVALWSGAADPRFVASSAVRALRKLHDDPFFMVVFFSTTHFPYAAPAPYHSMFTRPDYTGPFRYDKTVTASVPMMPNAADVAQIRGLYDGSVAAVDDAIGTILDEVKRLGAADDLLIVVTSDHGEALFEHDRWHGHGDHLFGDEPTHVPLVIFDPHAPPHRERALVASVDLAPTLYELLGQTPPPRLDGRSLAPALRGEALTSRPVFAETELWLGFNPGVPEGLHLPPPSLAHLMAVDSDHGSQIVLQDKRLDENLVGRHRMVRDDRWKLLYMPTPKGIVYRLFDLSADPEQLTDVEGAHPEEAARMKALLWEWMLGDPRLVREGESLVVKDHHAAAP